MNPTNQPDDMNGKVAHRTMGNEENIAALFSAEDIIRNVMFTPFCGCWLWTGHLTDRKYGRQYGRISFEGKNISAHRLSYMIFKGVRPRMMFVCHKCDTPACVNPDHLFLGTNMDNVRDMISKNRHHYLRRTHCTNGHEYNEQNTYLAGPTKKRQCRVCARVRHAKLVKSKETK